MPFREDIDLSPILPRFTSMYVGENKLPDLTPAKEDTPVRYGGGPTTVSSSMELERYPSVCWDVNGYYRELGVFWRASRKELMEAYQRADGPNDSRLTYVFRQLLQPEIRAEYDLMPPGSVFIDDYVQEALMKNAKMEAQHRQQQGEYVDEHDILDEWGFQFVPEGEEEQPSRSDVEMPETTCEEGGGDAIVETLGSEDVWPYSFYQLETTYADSNKLEEWQWLLRKELRDTPIQLAVGYSGTGGGFKIRFHEGKPIFFLHEDADPSVRIAEMAAATYKLRYMN